MRWSIHVKLGASHLEAVQYPPEPCRVSVWPCNLSKNCLSACADEHRFAQMQAGMWGLKVDTVRPPHGYLQVQVNVGRSRADRALSHSCTHVTAPSSTHHTNMCLLEWSCQFRCTVYLEALQYVTKSNLWISYYKSPTVMGFKEPWTAYLSSVHYMGSSCSQ